MKRYELRYIAIMADLTSDPLAWRPVKAPSLAALEVLAGEVFRALPKGFRDLCADLVIQVDDFPSEEVLTEMQAETEFDLLGLFQGIGLHFCEDFFARKIVDLDDEVHAQLAKASRQGPKHLAGQNFERGERGRLDGPPGQRIGCKIGHNCNVA